jgi:hypothetical protein
VRPVPEPSSGGEGELPAGYAARMQRFVTFALMANVAVVAIVAVIAVVLLVSAS